MHVLGIRRVFPLYYYFVIYVNEKQVGLVVRRNACEGRVLGSIPRSGVFAFSNHLISDHVHLTFQAPIMHPQIHPLDHLHPRSNVSCKQGPWCTLKRGNTGSKRLIGVNDLGSMKFNSTHPDYSTIPGPISFFLFLILFCFSYLINYFFYKKQQKNHFFK